jgi:hypothetical protein
MEEGKQDWIQSLWEEFQLIVSAHEKFPGESILQVASHQPRGVR